MALYSYPWPLIEIAIEPKSKADRERLGLALARLVAEDASLHASIDTMRGQTILGGVSEQHLDDKVDVLKRTSRVDAFIGAPQVAYRETLTRRVEQDYTHQKQIGGTGQFAQVKSVLEPNDPGAGNVFESTIVGSAVPKEYIAGVEKGITSIMEAGPLAGFPVIDVKATLIDGAVHDVDSSVLAFEIATRAAVHAALRKGGLVLFEPIMKVEVVTPEDYTGSVIGDLDSRRGQFQGQDTRGDAKVIKAMVPLVNMFGYADQLRSSSQGCATFTMQFDHIAPRRPGKVGGPRQRHLSLSEPKAALVHR